MNIEKTKALITKCESLDQTLEMAYDEALDIQKAVAGAENLDVMHISNAREVVAMRIGYLRNQVDRHEAEAKEKAEADKKAKEEAEAKEKAEADKKAKEEAEAKAKAEKEKQS